LGGTADAKFIAEFCGGGFGWALGGAVLVVSGCEGQVRYYDAGYSDYHVWDHGEVVYYT